MRKKIAFRFHFHRPDVWLCAILLTTPLLTAQNKQKPFTLRAAAESMQRWPNGAAPTWGFELGISLAGINAVWDATKDPVYLNYLQHVVDHFVQADGTINTYDLHAYSLNNLLPGRALLTLYQETHQEKYRKAAETLRQQLTSQPRTASGGFWHTANTPNLMLLDDQFMLSPFYAEYARLFHEPQDLDDIVKQFSLLEQHTLGSGGLMYHGWDESRKMPWANPKTGTSPNLWARAMGWYLMALVDTLQYVPKGDPHHAQLRTLLQRACAAVAQAQDPQSHLWYQILDKPGAKENYIESSSVLMITYAFARGARLHYLPARYGIAAQQAWRAIETRFLHTTAAGQTEIIGTVTHVALGATPKDDGSYDYYLHAPVVTNDAKGVGALLLAGSEMELRGPKFSSSQ